MINTAALTGRLTRDPELKYTQSGIPVISFTLAVNRTFKNSSGEREADFIICQAWRATAELIANNLHKGSLIGVEGRIQTRNYQDNDGKTVYITEVVVDNLIFLETKAESQNNNYHSQNNQQKQTNMNQAGGYKSGMSQPRTSNPEVNQTYDNPFESSSAVEDISDDDLPF